MEFHIASALVSVWSCSFFFFWIFPFCCLCFCLFDFTSSLDSVFLNFPFNLFLWNSIAEVWKGYNHSCRNGQIAEFVAISVLCYFSATLWLLKLMDSLWQSLGILIYQCTCNVVNTAIMIIKVFALVYKFVIGCFEIKTLKNWKEVWLLNTRMLHGVQELATENKILMPHTILI